MSSNPHTTLPDARRRLALLRLYERAIAHGLRQEESKEQIKTDAPQKIVEAAQDAYRAEGAL
jgi:hypothetical protein